ncbi:MAG TPA: penicillin-binding transpeptidase domain-containing protein [Bacillota bacterium]|mgnify:CR=1 FL=1|nr:penicillin-binding transpeptidase domain-containing protein [Bacillota bacterium]
MGIDSDIKPVLSLPLGTSEITPLEMARAFDVLANGGVRVRPYYIRKVSDKTGRVIEENKPELARAINEKTAYIITGKEDGRIPNAPEVNITGFEKRN